MAAGVDKKKIKTPGNLNWIIKNISICYGFCAGMVKCPGRVRAAPARSHAGAVQQPRPGQMLVRQTGMFDLPC